MILPKWRRFITYYVSDYSMSIWFLLSCIGLIAVVPLHFASVEHNKLEKKYGAERGRRIGATLGMISGWGIFIFLIGLWISPQPQFLIPLLEDIVFILPLFGLLTLQIPLVHLLLGIAFVVPGAWFGIKGVTDIGLKESETHRPERVITTGLYSRMRHPQYTGAILSHIGITFILSAFYSLLVTPLVIFINYILCWKEEKELVIEFGEEYIQYQKSVPMFIPRIT